ncbi:Potassium-transporting ATPase ATP-binding subunit [Streptomyces hirsutus]
MPSALDQRPAPAAAGPRPALPRRRTRVLALPEARWALAALVLFLLALPLYLLGAPGWLWGTLFAATYVAGGWEPGWEGLKALKDKTLDVDLLMVVAALGAAAIGQVLDGALLIVIFATSGALEAIATARTADSVRGLLDLAPSTATRLLPDGTEESVDAAQLTVGDTILVRPGERVGADGQVLDGAGEVDQATITGEPLPVAKQSEFDIDDLRTAVPEGEAAGGGRTRTVPLAPLVALASLGTVVLLVIAAVVLLPDDERTGDSKGGGAAGPTPGWSRVRPVGAPTLCLTDGEARVDGDTKTVAVQRPCTEAVPPRTYLQRESDGLYIIKWDHPDHGPGCLTVLDGGPFHGMLEPWPWKACQGGSTAQRFRIERAPGGGTDHWRFRPAQDAEPLCVGIRESAEDPDGSQGSDKAGAVAVAQRCTVQDANGQVFIIEPE